jgi:hypothetical protein
MFGLRYVMDSCTNGFKNVPALARAGGICLIPKLRGCPTRKLSATAGPDGMQAELSGLETLAFNIATAGRQLVRCQRLA